MRVDLQGSNNLKHQFFHLVWAQRHLILLVDPSSTFAPIPLDGQRLSCSHRPALTRGICNRSCVRFRERLQGTTKDFEIVVERDLRLNLLFEYSAQERV